MRQNEKYCAGHIPGAINIPYEELQDRVQEIKKMLAGQPAGRKESVSAINYVRAGKIPALKSLLSLGCPD